MGGGNGSGGSAGAPPEDLLPEPLATAGFIELEPVSYSYTAEPNPSTTHQHVTSSRGRLFYSFVPADSDPKSAPVFVLFNGGPASATTSLLRVYGTGPSTLTDPTVSPLPEPNPNSWTTLGNLLYIDTRQAGFSYSTLADPANADARRAELSSGNFNAYVDAADCVRVVLRVLGSMPALRNNPIVLVGESYGGARASNMLKMLLEPASIATLDSGYYGDPALAAEIGAHYAAVFPAEDVTRISASTAARQFGWQILIQPALAYAEQYLVDRCSPAYSLLQRTQELGLSCPPSGRDTYDWSKPSGWSRAIDEQARLAVTSLDGFSQLLGVPAASVSGLSAAERNGAYRIFVSSSAPFDPAEWVSQFGAVPDYDRYFLALNSEVSALYGPLITSVRTYADGLFFLQNLRYVHTFITRAELDPVVVSDAIPEVLDWYRVHTNPPKVTQVALDLEPRSGTARPGWITVTYGTLADIAPGEQRIIRFPTYHDAGHTVSVSSPGELYADVRDFLGETLP